MPENKNLANLAETIGSLRLKTKWDPNNPSFEGLKSALDAGVQVPLGTEVPDTYGTQECTWRVVHYGMAKRSSDSGTVDGVYLQLSELFETSPMTSATYSSSNMIALLNNSGQGVYNKLSSTIKELVTQIKVPFVYYPQRSSEVNCKFFIPSATEIGGVVSSAYGDDGVYFDYYKFAATPTDSAVSGRILKTKGGAAGEIWTRTSLAYNLVRLLNKNGSITNNGGGPYYVSVVCFIKKD